MGGVCDPVPQQDKRVLLMAVQEEHRALFMTDEVPLGWLRGEGSRRIRQKGGNGLLAGYHGNAPLITSEAAAAERVEEAIFSADVLSPFLPFNSFIMSRMIQLLLHRPPPPSDPMHPDL